MKIDQVVPILVNQYRDSLVQLETNYSNLHLLLPAIEWDPNRPNDGFKCKWSHCLQIKDAGKAGDGVFAQLTLQAGTWFFALGMSSILKSQLTLMLCVCSGNTYIGDACDTRRIPKGPLIMIIINF